MRIIDTLGRTFLPGQITEVPTGNLLWVDAVNGNDDLAVRGRMTVPFKTLTKAKTAAASGDTIMVLPGTYNENNLAKNGVNWHFLTGAVVEYSGTGAGVLSAALFDTAQTGGAATFKVTGNGVFKTTNSSNYIHAFSFTNSADVVTLQFDRIESRGAAINSDGSLTAAGNEAKSTAITTINLGGSNESVLNIDRILSAAASAVAVGGTSANCIVRIRAVLINSTAGYTFHFSAGTAYVDAYEISSSGGMRTVVYDCASNHRLHLRVTRIVNTMNSTSARALEILSGSAAPNGAVHLYGCVLFSKYGTYAVSADSAKDVICPQWCVVKAKTTGGGSGSSNVTARIHTFLDVTSNTNVGDL